MDCVEKQEGTNIYHRTYTDKIEEEKGMCMVYIVEGLVQILRSDVLKREMHTIEEDYI